jgi:hypothetical protein
MINSLLSTAEGVFFPLNFHNVNISESIKMAFPEFKTKYGPTVDVGIQLELKEYGEPPFKFSTEKGISFGDLDCVKTILKLTATNDQVKDEVAVQFNMFLQVAGNLTMRNFVIFPTINEVIVEKTNKTLDHVGIKDQPFDDIFTMMLDVEALTYNNKYKNGWALANLDPQLAMISGLIKNQTLTPYVADEWLYAGISMQADLPTMEQPAGVHQLEFIQ